jgi:hypothetical protein
MYIVSCPAALPSQPQTTHPPQTTSTKTKNNTTNKQKCMLVSLFIYIHTYIAMLTFLFLHQAYCDSRGAYLVRLETPGEYLFVKEYLKKTGGKFIVNYNCIGPNLLKITL